MLVKIGRLINLYILLSLLLLKKMPRKHYNNNKWYSITIGKKEDKDHTYHISDKGTKYNMAQINNVKDIRVIMDSDLKFEKHINSKINTANKILGII